MPPAGSELGGKRAHRGRPLTRSQHGVYQSLANERIVAGPGAPLRLIPGGMANESIAAGG